jgi:soluble lytic murein transglycosylase-like protein
LASEELETLFNKYGTQYNVSPGILRKIAACESGFNANAVNGPFAGMFQFLASTWSANRNTMGLDPNPELRFNAEESIRTTAYKISKDGVGAWPVCGR